MKKIVCKIICIFALTSLLTLQINAEDDLANQPATCDVLLLHNNILLPKTFDFHIYT